MTDDHPVFDPGNDPGNERAHALQRQKVFLDFVSKSLYPLIVAVVLVFLYPTIKGLLSRLESANIAGNELNFAQAEQVGEASATLNSRIVALEREADALREDLQRIQAQVPEATAPPEVAQARERRA